MSPIFKYNRPPSTHIQWKGTEACLDFACACGWVSHWDAEFLYSLQCPGCDKVWKLGTAVEVFPGDPDDTTYIRPTPEAAFDMELDRLNTHRATLGLPPVVPASDTAPNKDTT